MSDSLAPNSSNGASPFDAIKRVDEHDRIYWSARELMEMLGYVRWQSFKECILAAIENIEASYGDASGDFVFLEIKTKGRPKEDIRVSRRLAYHIALCCDGRGRPNVKSAKTYFAHKTRQAEIVEQRAIQDNSNAQDAYWRAMTERVITETNILKKQLAEMQGDVKQQIDESKAEVVNVVDSRLKRLDFPTGDYFTIIGWATHQRLQVDRTDAIKIGKATAKYCRLNNIEIKEVTDGRYGRVNSYPYDAISTTYASLTDQNGLFN